MIELIVVVREWSGNWLGMFRLPHLLWTCSNKDWSILAIPFHSNQFCINSSKSKHTLCRSRPHTIVERNSFHLAAVEREKNLCFNKKKPLAESDTGWADICLNGFSWKERKRGKEEKEEKSKGKETHLSYGLLVLYSPLNTYIECEGNRHLPNQLFWNNRGAYRGMMRLTSYERETAPRDGDLSSSSSLLHQQFATAAQSDGFARSQSSVTLLTEEEKI